MACSGDLFGSHGVGCEPNNLPQAIKQYGDVFLIDLEVIDDVDVEIPQLTYSGQTSTQGKKTNATDVKEKRESSRITVPNVLKNSWIQPEGGPKEAVFEVPEKSLPQDKEPSRTTKMKRRPQTKMKGSRFPFSHKP